MNRDETLEILADILSRVVHDYNNILGAVEGYVTLIESETNEEIVKNDASEILSVLSKAGNIRSKLALFYRKNLSVKSEINLNDIIKSISLQYNDIINIELDLFSQLSLIKGNPDEINIMIKELFENTINHSGMLKPDVYIKTFFEDNYIYLEFSDNGKGIDPTLIDKVFFPFFTTISDNTREGLGLSWVWGIARRHNAKIFLESMDNRFTKFILKFKL